MNQLKKQIVGLFLAFAFAIALLESIADSIFDTFIAAAQERQANEAVLIEGYIFTSALIFAVLAYGFMKILNKKIEAQTQQQLKENNLLYANIAHDLKTPITSILGFAKAIQDHKVKPEQYEAVAETIYTKAKRTDALINQLFDYTRLETNQQPLTCKRTDICTVLRNITATHYEEFEAKRINLEIDIPEESIWADIDEAEFTRAISNLIVNAYTHNKEGSKAGIILKKSDGNIRIIIADNGSDISVIDEERFFQPFVSGDEARNSEKGSGLGLAIAKCIVERHGGRLRITREIPPYSKAFVIKIYSD